MKKIFIIAVVALTVLLTACGGVDQETLDRAQALENSLNIYTNDVVLSIDIDDDEPNIFTVTVANDAWYDAPLQDKQHIAESMLDSMTESARAEELISDSGYVYLYIYDEYGNEIAQNDGPDDMEVIQ
ncbi:hypothetical protein FRZ06_04165 [Anoxybacterium hadale]|uniref:Uncharacterized protein n=1 Tax=Anoxybacterium hadale TaxID=3408580 RepID=A0ACD1A8A2_9FIRM|nr:hypothetical protein FRZ06_04165 [Clostridiales bacterium]